MRISAYVSIWMVSDAMDNTYERSLSTDHCIYSVDRGPDVVAPPVYMGNGIRRPVQARGPLAFVGTAWVRDERAVSTRQPACESVRSGSGPNHIWIQRCARQDSRKDRASILLQFLFLCHYDRLQWLHFTSWPLPSCLNSSPGFSVSWTSGKSISLQKFHCKCCALGAFLIPCCLSISICCHVDEVHVPSVSFPRRVNCWIGGWTNTRPQLWPPDHSPSISQVVATPVYRKQTSWTWWYRMGCGAKHDPWIDLIPECPMETVYVP